jgi:hypothetical protein
VRCLLHVQICPIGTFSLIGFTQNRVQRFFKRCTFLNEGDGASHDDFESLERVFDACSIIQIIAIDALYHRYALDDTFGLHTFDWETNLSQVEISRKNLFSHHLDDLSSAASESAQKFLVS